MTTYDPRHIFHGSFEARQRPFHSANPVIGFEPSPIS
jgi:hypothetical protein